MAKKQQQRRKRKTGLSEAPARRRRSPRKRGFLSELMNPTIAKNSAMGTLAAASGGFGAVFINKMLPATTGKFPKLLIALGGGFLGSAFSFPNAASGFTGGMMALNFQGGFLNEGEEETNFADEESLSDMPLFLDAEGEPFVIEEDESGETYTRYLSEREKEIMELEEAEIIEEY